MSKFYMDFYFTYYSGILFPFFFFLLASFLLFAWFLFFFLSDSIHSFLWLFFYTIGFNSIGFNPIGFNSIVFNSIISILLVSFLFFGFSLQSNVSDFFQYFCFIHTYIADHFWKRTFLYSFENLTYCSGNCQLAIDPPSAPMNYSTTQRLDSIFLILKRQNYKYN